MILVHKIALNYTVKGQCRPENGYGNATNDTPLHVKKVSLITTVFAMVIQAISSINMNIGIYNKNTITGHLYCLTYTHRNVV